ncbi:MAG: ATP-binding protein [Deferribacterales bacterium]
MKKRNIMIIESKPGATGNLENTLKGLTYSVRKYSFRDDDIRSGVEQFMPDALIVDMSVYADKNIIAKASLIQAEYSVPVIYFTEAINSRTLYQTMKTNHYGYIYSPYDESTLQTTIELALHKHRNDMSVKQSELKYKELFNNMTSGVAVYDLVEFGSTYIITEVNNAACLLLKRAREEIIGRPMASVYVNADTYGFTAALKTVEETSEPMRMDCLYYEDDVIHGWFNTYLYKLPTGSMVHIFHDITEQIEVEKKLKDKQKELELLNLELAKAVVEETDKRKKNEQIIFEQSRFLAMGQMISAIAHQWRQPLSALGINIEDLEDAYQAGDLDENYIKELTRDSMDLIRTISNTMDDLRSFFQSGHGAEKFEVSKVLQEVYSLQTAQFKKYGISFQLDYSTAGQHLSSKDYGVYGLLDSARQVYVSGVPAEFKQVIINLLNNSVDAIAESGNPSGVIKLHLATDNHMLNIQVADNGVGIRSDLVNKIFEPYFSTKETGSGIGLYMSKVIVEEHLNGSLTAASLPNGAVLSINIPLHAD